MTAVLKTPAGTMTLRPVQAIALYELGVLGFSSCPIPVGRGKTLVSLLAPHVLGATKPFLLLPAHLVEKTKREMAEMAKHWRVSGFLRIGSYQSLGRDEGMDELTRHRPDLLEFDECHFLKNPRAAVTRRVGRYIEEVQPAVLIMSGTFYNDLKAAGRFNRWSHGKHSPMPVNDGEIARWNAALGNEWTGMLPGALINLATLEERSTLPEEEAARVGFQRRLRQTPGVIFDDDPGIPNSLCITAHELKVSATTEENFRILRGYTDKGGIMQGGWETPDGWPLFTGLEAWRVARELALGMHGIWKPRPEEAWRMARKEWAKYVRDTIKKYDDPSKGLTVDSELQVHNACLRGALVSREWSIWQQVRDSYKIRTETVWHDRTALEACAKWLTNEKGICWVSHIPFGQELSRITGCPYYANDGLDANGNLIDDPLNTYKGPAIASVSSNATGRNLQKWSKNLITAPTSNGQWWEQLLARTHRPGQREDTVEVSVFLGCFEHWDALVRGRQAAKTLLETTGAAQKLLIADIPDWPSVTTILNRREARWSKMPSLGREDE